MKIFLALLLMVQLSFAISAEQVKNLQIAYSIGKFTKADDGTSFENTLASIMLRESSGCKFKIGDAYELNGTKRTKINSSLGCMQVRMITAREVAKKVKSLKWVNRLSDEKIASMLIHNNQFNVLIAAHYIRLNYNYAIKRGFWNPVFKTISRYNGGWHNKTYYDKVMKNMKFIKHLHKGGALR